VFQEGIRIPPVKVVRRGERNDDLIRTILQNSREPENVGGDFESQLAALKVGALRLEDVASRYGHNTLRAATSAIQQQSEIAMRHAIANVPDGDYAFEDFVDDDGINDERIRIHARLSIHGDSLTVDLSDCDEQVTGPVNCTLNMSEAAVVCALLMGLGRDIPANAGCYRPIAVVAPPGKVVNAIAPAPVANRMAVGHRVVTTVLGALANALPGQISAAYYGVSYAYALSAETVDDDGRVERGVYFDLECGGWGAHPDADGANGLSCGFHNVANSPVEMIEGDYPVLFHRYGLRVDSGGSGATRGGLGLIRDFELTGDAGRFSANLDRFKVAPYGLAGGASGATGKLEVKRGRGDWHPLASKVSGLVLERGDRIRLQTSGGGGYGDADSRSETSRANDRRQGYIT
jgi:N-methylhydantoinase B